MRKFATVALVLLVNLAPRAQQKPSGQQQTGNSRQQSEPATTLKVDVKLVNVLVTVTDAHGAPVAGLKKENFSVQEDGREQKIAGFDKESALPLSIALSVDTSLSTRRDLPLEQSSAKRFAHLIMRPGDAVAGYDCYE